MLKLEHLAAKDVLPRDWLLLSKSLAADYSGFGVGHLANELDQLSAQLWLIYGPEVRLLLVTELVDLPAGRELHLRHLAGHGWFKKFEQILDLIESLADSFGCRFISGRLRGAHAKSWYRRFSGKAAGVLVYKDRLDGKQIENNHDATTGPLRADQRWPEHGNCTRH